MRQPLKFGKYLLLERIAVGGMAEVFVAKAFGVEGFERLLAIKKILPTMGEDHEFQTMFIDEARIAVQLSHANIVQILELGKQDDNLFIAMEYVSGRDLRQLLERFRKRSRPLPVPQAACIVAKVCEALDYAHRKRDARGVPLQIVHRDVSPQNVIVSFEGDVKLIDFGIAKAESRLQQTQAGILKGKFAYMSPEQVRGLPIDHRSDVFAVGVLLWELLCGTKLFTGDSDFVVLEKVRKGEVPSPRSYNREMPEALERVVLKALAAEVSDRYQWASELHDALMRFTLVGDTVYGSRQLSEWMREEFAVDLDKEETRLRAWHGQGNGEDEDITPSDFSPEPPGPPARTAPPPPPPPPVQASAPPPPPPVLPSQVSTLPEQHRMQRATQAQASTPPSLPEPRLVPQPPPSQSMPPPPPREAAREAQRAPTRPPPPFAQPLPEDLPTIQMQGDALAAAERAFAQRRGAKINGADPADEDEATDVGTPTPFLDPGLLSKPPEGKPARASAPPLPASLLPAAVPPPPPETTPPRPDLGPSDLSTEPATPAVPPAPSLPPPMPRLEPLPFREPPPFRAEPRPAPRSAPPPVSAHGTSSQGPTQLREGPRLPPPGAVLPPAPRPPETTPPHAVAAPQAWHEAGDAPVVTARFNINTENTQPLPVQPAAFDVSEDVTAAPRAQRKGALVRAREQGRGTPPQKKSNAPLIAGIAVAVLALIVVLVLLFKPSGEKQTGRIALSLTPSVPAQLFLDGKFAGDLPPFVRTVPRGVHYVEVRASGYKPFTATANVVSATRPVSIDAELVADGPQHMEVHDVVLNQPDAVVPREKTRPAPSRKKVVAAAAPTAPVEEASVAPVKQPEPEPEPVKVAAPPPPAADAVGYLVAATYPVAKISIDGRDSGRWTPVAPASPIALAPGTHTVAFETMAGKRLEQKVEIEAGKTAKVFVKSLQ